MKTFKDWWSAFENENVIGIDEGVITQKYTDYSPTDIESLISNGLSESIERNFRQFCNWMNPDDLVIIGTGQATKFNISGIVRVVGDYEFSANKEPRHYRNVKILKKFSSPKSLQCFARVPRLELIDENDFHESILSLL